MSGRYVIYWCEHLRDGFEEGSKIVPSLLEALTRINEWNKSPSGRVTDFRLFELGKEIPLEMEKTEEPQPPKIETRIKLKELP